jgi:single-strand DNA-binding protein
MEPPRFRLHYLRTSVCVPFQPPEDTMSRSVNKVILVGNVGRDPDVQVTGSGTRVAHLSLATSRRIPRNGSYEERTDWHRLTLWDRLAQLAEDYVRKGDRLYVEGRMEYNSFEKSGVTIPTADIQVREIVLLGVPNGRFTAADDGESAEEDRADDEDGEDDDAAEEDAADR